jgi:hypothetical protein
VSFARWQPYYTDRELELDRRIHAFGPLLALIATPLLAESRRPGLVLPCAIYLLSLLGMLGSSTLFRDNVDWAAIGAVKDYYLSIPPMPDLALLWGRIERYRPIILTGVPQAVEEAADNKRAWVRLHLGAQVEVRCCLSKEKWLHASPGDILIDDWEKYRDRWVAKGGVWITHRSAVETIVALDALGL